MTSKLNLIYGIFGKFDNRDLKGVAIVFSKMKNKSSLWAIIVLAVLACALLVLPAMAEGDGDGSGGGKGVPLGLTSSNPADGQKDVPVKGDIQLTFNKNVIFLGIRDANKTCFSLSAADGSQVPIEVIMADDQLEFEKRRDIALRPLEELKPGTAYVVRISPQLQAKNGSSLGHEVTVNFVTAGKAAAVEKPVSEPVVEKNPAEVKKPVTNLPDNEVKKPAANLTDNASGVSSGDSQAVTEAAGETENKAAAVENNSKTGSEDNKEVKSEESRTVKEPTASAEKAPLKEAEEAEQSPFPVYAVIAGVVLVAGVGYIFLRKGKMK